MPSNKPRSLWEGMRAAGPLQGRALHAVAGSIGLDRLASGSALSGALDEMRGRSVVLAVAEQVLAGLLLVELDGLVGRLVLFPPDVAAEHLASVVAIAHADAVVGDGRPLPGLPAACKVFDASSLMEPAMREPRRQPETASEWVLLTSGTTGVPKLVLHTLASLSAPIAARPAASPALWSTFYD